MLSRLHVRRVSWTLVDQGVISASSFALNVVLARAMSTAEYGVFGLLYGGLLTLQIFSSALLFYPLSVQLAVAGRPEQQQLIRATSVLVALLALALGGGLGIAFAVLRRLDLFLPTLACFAAWQVQETFRRALLANFRSRAALIGDAVSYVGQLLLVLLLTWAGRPTLPAVLYILAATSILAAALQTRQLRLSLRGPLELGRTLLECWRIGGHWSLGGGVLAQAPGLIIPWTLGAAAGPTAVAGYQAATNIVNLSNPLSIGLCNIIPQAAASEASLAGARQAWRATWHYAALGLPVMLAFSAAVLIFPGHSLWLVYGGRSSYLTLTAPLQLLILSRIAIFLTEISLAYLQGIKAAPLAFLVNATGAAAAAVLAWLTMRNAGLMTACVVICIMAALRLAIAGLMVSHAVNGRNHFRVSLTGGVVMGVRPPRGVA